MAKTSHDLVMAARARIQEISLAEARSLLAQNPLVLDVREPDEFVAGHLPGAINVPRGLLEFRLAGLAPLLQTPPPAVLVYCKTGGRAALATVVLHEMGVTQAMSLAGGFDAWAGAGLPVDQPAPLDFE
mgnify:CR=1 FL=1